jgi:hypothetical protein
MRSTDHEMLASEEPKKRLTVSEYLVPQGIYLEVGRLYWPVGTNDFRLVKPTNATFHEFVNLAESNEKKVLGYARRWGMLGLCRQHLTPVGHNLECQPLQGFGRGEIFNEGEPIIAWQRWAQVAGAMLNISQRLDDNQLGDKNDWQVLYDYAGYGYGPLKLPWHDPSSARQVARSEKMEIRKRTIEKADLAYMVNEWLRAGWVRPHLVWAHLGEPMVTLCGSGLFGALAVHLLELSGRYIIASCSGCRNFYYPEIRPKSGQDRFCQKCRDAKIPVQLASHRRNLRKAAARKEAGQDTAQTVK